jgi:hypothetical protein
MFFPSRPSRIAGQSRRGYQRDDGALLDHVGYPLRQ